MHSLERRWRWIKAVGAGCDAPPLNIAANPIGSRIGVVGTTEWPMAGFSLAFVGLSGVDRLVWRSVSNDAGASKLAE